MEMAQTQMMKFNMGPLGPQLMAEVDLGLMMDKPKASMDIGIESEQGMDVDRNRHHGKKKACVSTIMHMNIKKNQFLVGDVFMRKFYTIFDRDNDRVGLALASSEERLKKTKLAEKN